MQYMLGQARRASERHVWCAAALVILSGLVVARAEEAAPGTNEIGQPTKIEIFPAAVKLSGPRSKAQLVVTGRYADGSVRDLTQATQFASTDSAVATTSGGVAAPRQDGKAQIVAVVGGQAAVVPVEVAGFGSPQ